MKQIFILTIDVPDIYSEISAETIKKELLKALDDSPLWNVKVDVAKMHKTEHIKEEHIRVEPA